MSSTSSLCSSEEGLLDGRTRKEMPPAVRSAVERFSLHCSRLRQTLDVHNSAEEGDSLCVSIHAALEQVNESVRDLLRMEIFKTNAVILPSLQLVHSIKELKFVGGSVDTRSALLILDSLLSAVLNCVVHRHMPSSFSLLSSSSSTHSSAADMHSQPLPSYPTIGATRLRGGHSLANADNALIERDDGVELAFDRAKTSSRYCKELAIFVKGRLNLEAEHAKKVNALVEQTRLAINESFLPLRGVFESGFNCELDFACTVKETIEHLNDRFLKALECRRNEHDNMRRALKGEWNREQRSHMDAESEERRAAAVLAMREDALCKVRQKERLAWDTVGGEKRKKNEEDALYKVEDARRHLSACSELVHERRVSLLAAKERTILKLRELVLQCDQTTKACASHYFKALASLWMALPHKLGELAERVRTYEPGTEYMSFVDALPPCSSSPHSSRSEDGHAHRRNAINPEQVQVFEGIRKHKKSIGRSRGSRELSSAARSHPVVRTVQPSKCDECGSLSLIAPLQCTACLRVWHRHCFPSVREECGGQRQRVSTSEEERRMSVFGVRLDGHLRVERRDVPFILESAINEIQWRGMRVKGIYRTCGVKSKVEEICEQFEKKGTSVELSHVHPMNLASVVKLYLRKLPDPLLSHSLYHEWIALSGASSEEEEKKSLSRLISLLPAPNRSTLQFLLLHLNRVSWFHESNLMCASNLSTVITPSLIWPPPSSSPSSSIPHLHSLNSAVKLLIRHAFELFNVDREKDWEQFSALYSMEMPKGESEEEELEARGKSVEMEEEEEEDEEEELFISPRDSQAGERGERLPFTTSITVSEESCSPSAHLPSSPSSNDLFPNSDVSYV